MLFIPCLERILEDFETIDAGLIEDYNNRSRHFESKYSNDLVNSNRANEGQVNVIKYYLVLRQSTLKYDVFRSKQVSTAIITSIFIIYINEIE